MIFEALLTSWEEQVNSDLQLAIKFSVDRHKNFKEYGNFLLLLSPEDRRMELLELFRQCKEYSKKPPKKAAKKRNGKNS